VEAFLAELHEQAAIRFTVKRVDRSFSWECFGWTVGFGFHATAMKRHPIDQISTAENSCPANAGTPR